MWQGDRHAEHGSRSNNSMGLNAFDTYSLCALIPLSKRFPQPPVHLMAHATSPEVLVFRDRNLESRSMPY